MSSTLSAIKPQEQAQEPQQQAKRRQEPISAFKATVGDLLVGEVGFMCEHKFNYILP
jgi:hypothetical protein